MTVRIFSILRRRSSAHARQSLDFGGIVDRLVEMCLPLNNLMLYQLLIEGRMDESRIIELCEAWRVGPRANAQPEPSFLGTWRMNQSVAASTTASNVLCSSKR